MTGFKPATIEAIKSALDRGLSIRQAAGEAGVCYLTAYRYAKAIAEGIPEDRIWRAKRPDERSIEMARLYRSGETLASIGNRYGVTRERVRQVLTRDFEITAKDSGRAQRRKLDNLRRAANRDARYLRTYGCTVAQHEMLLEIGRQMVAAGSSWNTTPTGAFALQRKNAEQRGIGWELNLWQWWSIWSESGRWKQRGRGAHGYVMARNGDTGPYAAWNVAIVPTVINVHAANNKSGLPCGVRRANSREYEAIRTIGGKQFKLGRFPTPELARAAYIAAGAA